MTSSSRVSVDSSFFARASSAEKNRPSRGASRRRLSAAAFALFGADARGALPSPPTPRAFEANRGGERKSPARAAEAGAEALFPEARSEPLWKASANGSAAKSAPGASSDAAARPRVPTPLRRGTETASVSNDSAAPPAFSEEKRSGNVATLFSISARRENADVAVTPVAHAKPSTSVAPSTTRARVLCRRACGVSDSNNTSSVDASCSSSVELMLNAPRELELQSARSRDDRERSFPWPYLDVFRKMGSSSPVAWRESEAVRIGTLHDACLDARVRLTSREGPPEELASRDPSRASAPPASTSRETSPSSSVHSSSDASASRVAAGRPRWRSRREPPRATPRRSPRALIARKTALPRAAESESKDLLRAASVTTTRVSVSRLPEKKNFWPIDYDAPPKNTTLVRGRDSPVFRFPDKGETWLFPRRNAFAAFSVARRSLTPSVRSSTIMAAISCNALGAVGVVASARAPVASRGAVAAMPVRTQAKSVGFGSEAQRRGLAMNAARGRSTRGARGFEVVAQAISEVRTHEHTFRPPSRSRTRSANRDAPRDASPGARHASLSRRQNPEPRDEKRCATRRGAGPGGLGAARPSRETRAGVGAGGRVACFATRASLRGDAARSRRAPSPRARARPRNQALSGAPARRRNVYPLFSDSEL